MHTTPPLPHPRRQRAHQRGVALFVVIVFVMMSMLLALWASRTSFFNEMLVGNDADYQRAFEAAQALLQDAELDIRRERPDGKLCTKTLGAQCRDNILLATKIPLDAQEVTPLLADLNAEPTKCSSALCTKRFGRQDFWNQSSATTLATGEIAFADMTVAKTATTAGIGARYGDYTGATVGDPSDATKSANPILADTSKPDSGGWYWIEILPYDESSKNSGLIVDNTTGVSTKTLLALNLKPNVAYRITALAYGRKPGTMVVLQQSYVRQVQKD